MSRLEARLPFYLLIAMTIISFGGPFALVGVLRGGNSSGWPPDRAVEWVVVVLIGIALMALMALCLTFRFWMPSFLAWRSSAKSPNRQAMLPTEAVSSNQES
jgi:hypothetical protein